MFSNVFEELMFLRFISKNAKHQRKMNHQMLKAQQESVRLQREKIVSTQTDDTPKTRAERKARQKAENNFDLAETIKGFKPLEKNSSSESKKKHVWLSILLTLTLGPIGLLYSTKKYTAIMTVIFVLAAIVRIDNFIVWLLINTTIVAIGAYKTIEWNESLNIKSNDKE